MKRDCLKRMKKVKNVFVILVVIVLCVGMTACPKEDFDAKGYVRSALDACYHEEYAQYAKLLDISEEEAKKQMDEDFMKSIREQFTEDDGISENGLQAYADKINEAYKLAKYEVKEARETEDGDFAVTVEVEPSDVFMNLEAAIGEVCEEKMKQEQDPTQTAVFEQVLIEGLQKCIDRNQYTDPVTVEVFVTRDNEGVCRLEEPEMNKLENAMFPQE